MGKIFFSFGMMNHPSIFEFLLSSSQGHSDYWKPPLPLPKLTASPWSTLIMPINSLPPWPPQLPDDQLIHLQRLSTLYSLSHSFCHLPPNSPDPPTQTYAAPLSLFPSPFPRHLFENACELQTVYNALYARIALDWKFLDKVMEKVVEVDMFQAELWYGWKRIRDELVQVCQTLSFNPASYTVVRGKMEHEPRRREEGGWREFRGLGS